MRGNDGGVRGNDRERGEMMRSKVNNGERGDEGARGNDRE